MITYKGDKFVKGKIFNYNNEQLKFITKSKKGYIFESINNKLNNKQVILSEDLSRPLKEYIRNVQK